MKIVATLTDSAMAYHLGGNVEKWSSIIDLGDNVPSIVYRYLQAEAEVKEGEPSHYMTLSFSLLIEEK